MTSPAPGHPASAPSTPAPADRPPRLPAWLAATRPRQWVKNVLVFAAPLAAGTIGHTTVLGHAALAAVAFVCASAAIYLLNDVRDVAEDRLHPTKSRRPIASGRLSPRVAVAEAVVAVIAALALAWLVSPASAVVIAVYLVLQVGYSLWFKHEPILDLAIVASGFMLRAIMGGVATHTVLSQWFLLVAGFGSLFMVAGKRYSEFVALGADAGTRRSLRAYSESYLRFIWQLACAMVMVSYSLWAFEAPTVKTVSSPWSAISIAPFALALLRYALRIDAGRAGAPEDVVLHDPKLLGLGAAWLAVVLVGTIA